MPAENELQARHLTRKEAIRRSLVSVRERTLWLLSQVPDEFLRRRVHSFYSPIGWHFGHVGRTEEYWVVNQAMGRPVSDDHLSFMFADLADNPKDNRVNIPDRAGIVEYLSRTRVTVLSALDEADLSSEDPFLDNGYAWDFAVQHECQHQETIAEMFQLIQKQLPQPEIETLPWSSDRATEWVKIKGGSFLMGSNAPNGYDNEKRSHEAEVATFHIAKYPVTAFEWSQFMSDGGYLNKALWSEVGWQWREAERARCPEYWLPQDDSWVFLSPIGVRAIHPDEPASCISWHEACAYARWAGKRLPTELEWEFVAAGEGRHYPWGAGAPTADQASFGLNAWAPVAVDSRPRGNTPFGVSGMAGGVWEWTSSKFLPYPGFRAFPYDGYSKDHMEGKHYVCRGGSWATAAPILRCTFRNWYVPTYRQGFLGLRLAE